MVRKRKRVAFYQETYVSSSQIFGLMDYYQKVTSEQQAKRKTENDKTENENKREREDEDKQEGQIEKKAKPE